MLSDIHTRLLELPNRVRDRICQECNMTIPTIYRKMRARDKVTKFNRVVPALSNAEKRAIIKVVFEELKLTWLYFDKYRNK